MPDNPIKGVHDTIIDNVALVSTAVSTQQGVIDGLVSSMGALTEVCNKILDIVDKKV